MSALDDVTVAELVAIRNSFDKSHRVHAETMHKKYGGVKVKQMPVEFSPVDTVYMAIMNAVDEVYRGAVSASKLVLDLCAEILDLAHNIAIELLDWPGIHLFVLKQFDTLIENKKAATANA